MVRKGRLTFQGLQRFEQFVRTLRDGPILISLRRPSATRSLEANRFYFGVCLKLLSEHTGYTVDELHEWAKARFIPQHVSLCDRNGEIKDDLVIGGTTTKLNRAQFYEYVEAIRKFAAEELDVAIPDPDPNWREQAAS